jgi:uncharacterized tellurite resistance protein B-like protein
MIFSYLQKLNMDELTTYLKCIASIAAVDGKIHQREKDYLLQMLSLLNIPEMERTKVVDSIKNPPDLKVMLKGVKNPHLKVLILQDAYMISYIDGDFHKSESKAISEIIKIFEIKEGLVNRVKDWAMKGIVWQTEGERLLKESIFYERIY